MENRRPLNQNSGKPFNRNKFQKGTGDRAFGERGFAPRDDRYRPKDATLPGRDARHPSRTEGAGQTRDNRGTQSRDNRFPRRDGTVSTRDNRFPNRDNQAHKRSGRPDPRKTASTKPKPPELPLAKVYSDLQITDGKLRGKFFKTNPSPKLRNTSRKLREVMFKIILRRVRGKRFLDICAGSGVIAIEAISRGSLLGTFVDRSAKMCSLIRNNMAEMEIKPGHGEVFEMEAVPFLKQIEKRRRFWDVVYFGAPFDTNYDEALEYFGRGACIESKGMLIIEHHAEMFFPEKLGRLRRWRVVVESDSALSFYEKV